MKVFPEKYFIQNFVLRNLAIPAILKLATYGTFLFNL